MDDLSSLPSRERGLKFQCLLEKKRKKQSLPSRERGLKLKPRAANRRTSLSLPSRERGLKSKYVNYDYARVYVAPLAGAWIEMPEK